MKINVHTPKCSATVMFIGLSLLIVWLTPAFADTHQQKMEYEAGFYYTVKEGDTLWDISQRFDDTPWVWPELWKENKQLPNPHWIYPGERIRLFRRSGQHGISGQPKAGPRVTAPVPNTVDGPQVNFHYSRMDRVGFIRKPPVTPSGVIFNVLNEKELVSAEDVVYIQRPSGSGGGEFSPGARFTLYRAVKPTEDRHSDDTIGTQHLLLGVVEVSRNESKYAIAKVIEGFRAIQPGDLLMEYQSRTPDIIVTDSTPGLEGSIICTEEHANLIGSNVTAFIDKGEVDNVRVGQQYTIYYQKTKRGANGEEITLAPVDVGSLLVLRTEKTTSTVFVTDARGKINPGYKIKTP